jgi:hypothetical protein
VKDWLTRAKRILTTHNAVTMTMRLVWPRSLPCASGLHRLRRHAMSSASSYSSDYAGSSSASAGVSSLWNPTEEHAALRDTLRTFVQREVRVTTQSFLLSSTSISLADFLAWLGIACYKHCHGVAAASELDTPLTACLPITFTCFSLWS